MQPSDALDPQDSRYEELLGLWADLEAGLSVVLAAPFHIHDLPKKIGQYDRWMQGLLEQDTDIAMYLLFQLAGTSTAGYSASHALVCAVLCHLAAAELKLPVAERDSLVRAAMTMNVAITQLQDELAQQDAARPTEAQQATLHGHGRRGSMLLSERGVADPLWLALVGDHHDDEPAGAFGRLTRLLQMIDRYAAMISPRKSRSGRSASDSLRAVAAAASGQHDELGDALARAVGLCPPGTFVRLSNGETAVVLRRGAQPADPAVAILNDARGRRYAPPRLHRSWIEEPTIESALPCSAVDMRLNHRMMVQLGLFAARQGHRAAL